MFQPSKQTGSFDVILAKRILRAEDSQTEFVVLVGGKENQVQENAILRVQTDKYMMFLLVIAMESSLLLCSVDDFSQGNETRIKVVSSYQSGHVEVQCPHGKKKHISNLKHCFDAVAKAINK